MGHSIYTLRIELPGITPLIWRRLLIDGSDSLGKLHHYLQIAMGWSDSHLHIFELGDMTYGNLSLDKEKELGYLDERKIILQKHLKQDSKFIYRYDLGDNWEHRVVVESVEPSDEPLGVAHVTAGENACPPEDIGGSGEYERFLECLREDPDSDECRALLEWAGLDFDPKRFDRQAANAGLLRLAWNRWGGN